MSACLILNKYYVIFCRIVQRERRYMNTNLLKQLTECTIRQVDECYLTCEDRGKWLQGVKRTFQSARLHCTGQQLEHTILRDETEDNVTLSKM